MTVSMSYHIAYCYLRPSESMKKEVLRENNCVMSHLLFPAQPFFTVYCKDILPVKVPRVARSRNSSENSFSVYLIDNPFCVVCFGTVHHLVQFDV